MAPSKQRFTVLSVSGEDPDYPARELQHHTPETRGWQCPRFSSFPQEIVIALEGPTNVHQIQLLSHEYKIATKIEVHVGSLPAGETDIRRCSMKRLGYLSFDSNRRSNFQARELKSVTLNTVATTVKLVTHRCHVNSLNIYNQVGIVALNVIGDKAMQGHMGGAGGGGGGIQQMFGGDNIPPTEDVTLDLEVDTQTAEQIRTLEREKRAAVADERYDDVKFIKDQVDRLRLLGRKIAELEGHKRRAVEVEDYASAKAIKMEVDRLRAAGVAGLDGMGGGGGHDHKSRAKDPMELFNRVLPPEERGQHHAVAQEVVAKTPISPTIMASPQGPESALPPPPPPPALSPVPLPSPQILPPPPPTDAARSILEAAAANIPHDEKPLPVPARAQGLLPALPDPMAGAQPERGGDGGRGGALPVAESIPSSLMGEAEPIIDAMGEDVAKCLLSKNWQLREQGLESISASLENNSFERSPEELFPVIINLLTRMLKDRVPGVFHAGLKLVESMFDYVGPHVGAKTVQGRVGGIVSQLIQRLGDVNHRVRAVTAETLTMLARSQFCGIGVVGNHVTKPTKNTTNTKALIGRIALLQELVPDFGVGSGQGALSLDGVMAMVKIGLNHPNGDVREAALRTTVVVYQQIGQGVDKYLTDLKPAMKDTLNAALAGNGGTALLAGAGGVSASPVVRKKKAPVPKTTPKPAQRGKQPAAAPKGNNPPARHVAPAPPPPMPPEDDELPPRSDDELPGLKKQLAEREKQYGPTHAMVAQAATDLAVLHNEMGRGGAAQPLFERALKIWEQDPAYGPEHADVAQTLTDLAVLHIESGRHAEGRPLLERAMAIQEKTLGADHPGVDAIRDVLQSLDEEG